MRLRLWRILFELLKSVAKERVCVHFGFNDKDNRKVTLRFRKVLVDS